MLLTTASWVVLSITGGLALAAIGVFVFLAIRKYRNHKNGNRSRPDWPLVLGFVTAFALAISGGASLLITNSGAEAAAMSHDLTSQGYTFTDIQTDGNYATVLIDGKLQNVRLYESGAPRQWRVYKLCPVSPTGGLVDTSNCSYLPN